MFPGDAGYRLAEYSNPDRHVSSFVFAGHTAQSLISSRNGALEAVLILSLPADVICGYDDSVIRVRAPSDSTDVFQTLR